MSRKVELAKKAVDLLAKIDEGAVTVTLIVDDMRDMRDSGNIDFTVQGFIITVFFDVGEWDYIDEIRDSDGTSINYKWFCKNAEEKRTDVRQAAKFLLDYAPKDGKAWVRKKRC